MNLQCPKCRRILPQIGNETLSTGDTVTCGLCLHIWTPVPVPLKPDTANAGMESMTFAPCSENCEPGRPPVKEGGPMCVRCAKAMDDCTCKVSSNYFRV